MYPFHHARIVFNPDIAIELNARLVILTLCCISRYFFVLDAKRQRLHRKKSEAMRLTYKSAAMPGLECYG